MAAKDTSEAIRAARNVADPWYRCQALANTAYRISDRKQRKRLVAEAFDAALECGEPNRIVTVSAWPLKVLCKAGEQETLSLDVSRLLAIANSEPSPVRRADALNHMLGAIVTGPRPLFWKVFDRFVQACLAPLENGNRNTKGESLLVHWAPNLHRCAPQRARELFEAIQGPVLRDRAMRLIADHGEVDVETWCGWPNLT